MINITKGKITVTLILLSGFVLAGWSLNQAPASPPADQAAASQRTPTPEEMVEIDKTCPYYGLELRIEAQDKDKTGNMKYANYLYYLAKLEGRISTQYKFYFEILEKAVAAKDKSAVPLIEEIIGGIKLEDLETDASSRLKFQLIQPLSQAWYNLTWNDATEEQKLESALYGLTPGSKLKFSPNCSREKVESLGKKARAKVYDILLNNNVKYDDAVYYNEMEANMAGLLCNDVFLPTEKEVQDILTKGGKFGKKAIVEHLWYAKNPRCIEATIAMIKDFDRSESIFYYLKLISRKLDDVPVEKKMPLIKYAIELAREMNTIRKTPGATFPPEIGAALSFSAVILNDMGKTPESVAYLKEWAQFEDAGWLTEITNTLNSWGESVSNDPSVQKRLEQEKKDKDEFEVKMYGQTIESMTQPSSAPTTTSAPATNTSK